MVSIEGKMMIPHVVILAEDVLLFGIDGDGFTDCSFSMSQG